MGYGGMDMGKKLGRHDGIEEDVDEYIPSHYEGKA